MHLFKILCFISHFEAKFVTDILVLQKRHFLKTCWKRMHLFKILCFTSQFEAKFSILKKHGLS